MSPSYCVPPGVAVHRVAGYAENPCRADPAASPQPAVSRACTEPNAASRQPAVFLWEGMLMYLDRPPIESMLCAGSLVDDHRDT